MTTEEVRCIEVCDGPHLHGYAIKFAGGWDAYVRTDDGMKLVVSNISKKDALKSLKESPCPANPSQP